MSKQILPILEKIDEDKGTLFSDLLSNKMLLEKLGDIDNLSAQIYRLLSIKMLSMRTEQDFEEGEDIRLILTQIGNAYLRKNKDVKMVKQFE